MSKDIETSLASLRRFATAPFQGEVALDEVAVRIESIDLGDAPATMRIAFAQLLLGDEDGGPPPAARALEVGGVDGLLLPPRLDDATDDEGISCSAVVWFHGGGYAFGSPETHWRVGAALAAVVKQSVFLPRYRLAPEHPWPAQLEDALAVVRALQDRGRKVALAGDSAGGHLALTAALALAREGRPVAALALCSPNTDRSGLNTTRAANSAYDVMNDDTQDQALAHMAFGDAAPDDPGLSPLLDDLSQLPPTWIEAGDSEVLRDDARLLAQRGRAAGAPVSCHLEPDVFHMWQLWTPWLEPANASIARMGTFLRDQLA